MELVYILMVFGVFSPVVLVITFVLVLILVCLCLSFMINTYFYSFLVFMLFMSGVVILLMYMCGIILVEKVLVSYKIYLSLLVVTIASLFFTFMSYELLSTSCYYLNHLVFYYEFYSVMKFLYFSFNLFSLFFIIYLLIFLVIVYEIVKKCSGPLRMKT